MDTLKYRVRTTGMSCSKSVSGIVVAVVTTLLKDGEERAFVVHEGCQNAMIKDAPYWNAVDQRATTGRPRC